MRSRPRVRCVQQRCAEPQQACDQSGQASRREPEQGDRAAERLRRVSATGAIALEKPLRAKSNLLSRFNLIWVVQLPSQIYTSSLSPQISGYFRAVPSRQEGRIAIVTNARRDVVDARASARKLVAGRGQTRERLTARRMNDAIAYGKTVWSRHPWLVPSCRWRI